MEDNQQTMNAGEAATSDGSEHPDIMDMEISFPSDKVKEDEEEDPDILEIISKNQQKEEQERLRQENEAQFNGHFKSEEDLEALEGGETLNGIKKTEDAGLKNQEKGQGRLGPENEEGEAPKVSYKDYFNDAGPLEQTVTPHGATPEAPADGGGIPPSLVRHPAGTQPESLPGAFRVHPPHPDNVSIPDAESIQEASAVVEPPAISDSGDEEEGLAVAAPVAEGSSLPQAQELTNEQQKHIRHLTNQFELRRNLGCLATGIFAALIFLLVFLLTDENGNAEEASQKETETPTMAPTTAPTWATLEDYVLSALPDYTAASLSSSDTTSPQSRAFQWILQDPMVANFSYPDWRVVQRFALATFFFATGGDTGVWFNASSWMSYTHECEWYDIKLYADSDTGGLKNVDFRGIFMFEFGEDEHICYEDSEDNTTTTDSGETLGTSTFQPGSYKHLWLPYNSLAGSLPEEVFLLTSLQSIDLTGNRLLGRLPSNVGLLTNLQIFDLTSNMLSGPLPSELGRLQKAKLLFLYSNFFTGTIVTELGQLAQLSTLRLDINELSGGLPTELGNMANLSHLILGENVLTGTLPVEVTNIAPLKDLVVATNPMSGTIPTELGTMSALVGLNFAKLGGLSGTIPTELGNIRTMKLLNLAENILSGNVPSELGLLESLFYIRLKGNQLTGTLPTEMGKLLQLEHFWCNENNLTGTIPPEYGAWDRVQNLNFNTNQFTGSVPLSLWNSTALQTMVVGENQLTGPIPTEIGLLTALRYLDLQRNKMNGTLPDAIGDFSAINLARFLLYENEFSGTLPPTIGNWEPGKLARFSVADNHFTGPVPHAIGVMALNASKLELFNISANSFSGLPIELSYLGDDVLVYDEWLDFYEVGNATTSNASETLDISVVDTKLIGWDDGGD